MWRVEGGGFPGGVTVVQSGEGRRVDLVWDRALEYTDSGQYVCTATSSNESISTTLDLLVRREYSCCVCVQLLATNF